MNKNSIRINGRRARNGNKSLNGQAPWHAKRARTAMTAYCGLAAASLLLIGAPTRHVAAGTITWTGTNSQLWSNNGNWTPSGTPNGDDVVIGSPASTATPSQVDQGFSINSLTVDSGSELDVNAGINLVVANSITDNGTIKLNGTAANSGTGLGINGAVLLTGSGDLVLNANSANLATADIFDNGSSVLTQDTNHTISGTGEITVNSFTNNGTVNANSSGNTLLLTRAAFTNTNLMEATGGGILQLNAAFTNTGGTIKANGGTVLLNGGSVTGGTLASASGSEIDEQNYTTLANVTLSTGSNLKVIDGNDLYFANGITNNGTITVNKGGSNAGTGISINGTVDLTGTGSIVLNANSANLGNANIYDGGSSNLTQEANHTISGTGEITVNNFTNNGTINANSSGNTLLLTHAAYINTNLMEATGGGILQLNAGFTNTGGTINANGGTVLLNGGSVTGGTLSSASGSEIDEQNYTTLANVTLSNGSNLNVLDGNFLYFATGITNDGTITVNKGGSNTGTGIGINGTVDLTGTGSIHLNAYHDPTTGATIVGAARIYDLGSSNLTQEADHTISGIGQINVNSFLNKGIVDANQSVSSTANGTVAGVLQIITNQNTYTNIGTLEATNGGLLEISSGVTNTDGTNNGTILAHGGNVQLDNNATISNGTLTSNGSSEFVVAGTAHLNSVTLSIGTHMVVNAGINLLLDDPQFPTADTITNNGTITINGTGSNNGTGISINGTVDLTGTGSIVLNANSANLVTANIYDGGSSNLTQEAGHTISGTGEISVNSFTNNGTVNANSNGNTLLLTRAAFTNTNLMEATGSGILQLNAAFTNTGGTINANGGTVQLVGGSVTGGTLTSITGSEIDEYSSTTLGGVTLSSGSNLNVMDGNNLYFASSSTITNNGTITVNKGGTNNGTGIGVTGTVLLTGSGNLVLNANSANLATANIFDNNGSNLTQEANHTISGTGEINVNSFTNNGTVNANSNGNTLLLTRAAFTNTNLMEATGSGILQLNAAFTNTGGTIKANGGTVQLIGGSVTGGTLTSITGSEIDEYSSTTLSGVTLSSGSNLNVMDGNNLYFASSSTITNNGTITVNKGGTNNGTGIGITGTVLLTGSGNLVLNANSANLATADIFDNGSSVLTQDTNHTISGTGEINVNSFTNNGTVNANSNGNTLLLTRAAFTNNNLMEATGGGTLNISNLSNYSSGTLTGGIYKAIDSGTGATLVLNDGNITTNAADVTISGVNSAFAQINTLAVNQGEFRVLNNRNFTAQAGFNNQGGLLQLGGGTFAITSGSFTNEGTVQGFGTVTPQVTNTGLIEATGGTLALSNGALDPGIASTLQSDAGATLDLSGGTTSSTTQYLVNNGNLTLGNNNVTVSSDYTNANFGVGNSFNPHANVSTTGGKILASGNTDLTITGSDVTPASTTSALNTYTMNFGNVHANSSTTLAYNITNPGSSGPIIRGAVQTTVNGGNITDSRLGGNGVIPGNGSVAPGQTSSANDVTFTPGGQDGALVGQVIHIEGNFDNIHQNNINISGAAWNFAAPSVSPTTVSLGDVHVGGSVTRNIAVSNTAPNDGFSEQLDGQLGTGSGNLNTNGASFSGLNAGSSLTPANALNVTLDTSAAGVRSGTANLALQSDGTAAGNSGLGITNLSGQTITMSATAFNYAVGSITSPTTINVGDVHVGDVVSNNITIQNSAVAGAFSENLDGQLGAGTGNAVTNTGTFTGLAAGSTLAPANTLTIGLNTASAGNLSGSASLALQSDGAGIDTLGKTTLAPQTISINATAYNLAVGSITSPTTINVGNVHVGDVVSNNITIQNSAASGGFSENLDGQLGAGTGNAVTNGGTFTGLAAGATLAPANTLTIGLNTATAGNLSGSAALALQSDGAGIDTLGKTTLASKTVSINATAYNYAVGAVTSPTTLNLGIVHTGDIVNQAITVGNSAPAGTFSEALDVQFGTPTGAATTNGGQINLLAAGGSNNSAMVVGINTLTAGTVSGSVNVNLQSDGQGSSGLGKTSLSPITINVSAQVNNFASALVLLGAHSAGVSLTENSATVYTLDLGTTSLNGGNLAAALGIENSATGPADTLAGNFNTSNASAFGLSGFSNFDNIGAGGANNLPNITLSDSASGTFSGVITLDPFSQNGSGFNGALNPITIDVNGTVTATPEPASLALLAIAGLGLLMRRRPLVKV